MQFVWNYCPVLVWYELGHYLANTKHPGWLGSFELGPNFPYPDILLRYFGLVRPRVFDKAVCEKWGLSELRARAPGTQRD